VQIISFLPSVQGLEFLLFDWGMGTPWQLLQAQGIQTHGQWGFWGLLAGAGFWEHSTVALQAQGEPGLLACTFFNHGAAGTLGLSYAGALVSLVF
jgi:hypothetical protein